MWSEVSGEHPLFLKKSHLSLKWLYGKINGYDHSHLLFLLHQSSSFFIEHLLPRTESLWRHHGSYNGKRFKCWATESHASWVFLFTPTTRQYDINNITPQSIEHLTRPFPTVRYHSLEKQIQAPKRDSHITGKCWEVNCPACYAGLNSDYGVKQNSSQESIGACEKSSNLTRKILLVTWQTS